MQCCVTSTNPFAKLEDAKNHPYAAPDISSHHAFHARELKQRADAVGVENITSYGKNPILFSDPSNESWTQFCKRILSL